MRDVAIRVENLSKRYRIGQRVPYKALRDVLTNVLMTSLHHLRNWRSAISNPDSNYIWALKDVSFEVKQGEVVGIIGRNGAGKSTLLKILSRITEPTGGYAEIHGRVGSLLEVGTGFHPELTGRENIYLNGAILGMRKAEIDRKFDEIVAFAEIEKFIDTPVKHYSSGMYVRLAFAVSAHLEPEILLVDEVLAVGDAAFQKKCLGKMGDVAKEGRTVLFVSHNMAAIARLCDNGFLFDQGRLILSGLAQEVIDSYVGLNVNSGGCVDIPLNLSSPVCLRGICIQQTSGKITDKINGALPFDVVVEYQVNCPVSGIHTACFFYSSDGTLIFVTTDIDCNFSLLECQRPPGRYVASICIPPKLFSEGTYSITVSFGIPFLTRYDHHENIITFSVNNSERLYRQWIHRDYPGLLSLEIPWRYQAWAEG